MIHFYFFIEIRTLHKCGNIINHCRGRLKLLEEESGFPDNFINVIKNDFSMTRLTRWNNTIVQLINVKRVHTYNARCLHRSVSEILYPVYLQPFVKSNTHGWLMHYIINVYMVERCAESHLDLFRDGAWSQKLPTVEVPRPIRSRWSLTDAGNLLKHFALPNKIRAFLNKAELVRLGKVLYSQLDLYWSAWLEFNPLLGISDYYIFK